MDAYYCVYIYIYIYMCVCVCVCVCVKKPFEAETLLHSLDWAAVGIGLLINADKTEYMCFNQRGDVFTLNGSSLKLVD